MTKDFMIKEVSERATDIMNADLEEAKYKIQRRKQKQFLRLLQSVYLIILRITMQRKFLFLVLAASQSSM